MRWNTVNYNCGEAFNGSHFKVTCEGIYSFYLTVYHASSDYGYVYLCEGGTVIAQSQRAGYNGQRGSIVVQTTVKLTKGMKIYAMFGGSGLEVGFQTIIIYWFSILNSYGAQYAHSSSI